MTVAKIATLLVTLVAVALVAACGGGGGGDPAPASVPQAPVNPSRPPSASDPLVLASANAVQAATLVLGFTEITVAFGQIASDWTQAIRSASGTLPQTTACLAGGSQSLTLLDSDASGNVSNGDTIQGEFTNCYIASLEGAVTGTALLQITSFNEGDIRDGGSLTLGPAFGFTDTGLNINFGGSFHYAIAEGRLGTSLRVTSPSWSVSLTDGSVSAIDTVRDIDASRSIRRDWARAETGIVAMTLVSELLRGTVTATSGASLSSFFDRYPDSGRISIAGANGTAVLDFAGVSAGTATVSFAGTSGTIAVDDASSGYLWSGTGITTPPDETGFRTKPATTSEFVVLQAPDFFNVRPSSRMSWQLSRPVTAGTVSACQLDKTRLRSGYNWGPMSVDCDVSITGALVEVQPRAQLVPGSAYFPRYTPSASFPNAFQLTDANGNTIELVTPPFDVVDTISARPALGMPGYIFGTLTETLSSSQSQAQSQPVSSFQWRQISGPAILFDNDKIAAPVVRAAGGVGNGIAVVELQVTNAVGEADYNTVDLSVVAEPLSALVATYRTGGLGPFTIVSDIHLSMPSPSFTARYVPANNALDVFMDGGRIIMSRPVGMPFVPGTTYNFVAGTIAGSTSGVILFGTPAICGLETDTVVLHEFQLNASNELIRLALDFVRDCDASVTTGSIRYRSNRPPLQ